MSSSQGKDLASVDQKLHNLAPKLPHGLRGHLKAIGRLWGCGRNPLPVVLLAHHAAGHRALVGQFRRPVSRLWPAVSFSTAMDRQ